MLDGNIDLKGEEGVVFYIAGYISKGLLKKSKCDGCEALFLKSRSPPNLEISDEKEQKERERFLKSIDRGGLVTPSELLYLVCMHAVELKVELFDDGPIQKMFFELESPREVFAETLAQKSSNTLEAQEVLDQRCKNGHKFLQFVPRIAKTMFNCISKNFIASINDKIHASRKRGSRDAKENVASRKITKLQS